MFYCKKCKEEHNYPESISRSVGNCEICGDMNDCFDVPSSKHPSESPEEYSYPLDEYVDEVTAILEKLSHISQVVVLGRIAHKLGIYETRNAINRSLKYLN